MAEANPLVRSACLCALPNAHPAERTNFEHEIRFDAKTRPECGQSRRVQPRCGWRESHGEASGGPAMGSQFRAEMTRGEFTRAWTGLAAKPHPRRGVNFVTFDAADEPRSLPPRQPARGRSIPLGPAIRGVPCSTAPSCRRYAAGSCGRMSRIIRPVHQDAAARHWRSSPLCLRPHATARSCGVSQARG